MTRLTVRPTGNPKEYLRNVRGTALEQNIHVSKNNPRNKNVNKEINKQ